MFFAYVYYRTKVTPALQTIRWTIKQKLRILVVIKLIAIERHTGLDFSLFHDKYVLLSRASKVMKEETHQDECYDRNIFTEEVNHGKSDVRKYNGQEVKLLFFFSNKFSGQFLRDHNITYHALATVKHINEDNTMEVV